MQMNAENGFLPAMSRRIMRNKAALILPLGSPWMAIRSFRSMAIRYFEWFRVINP
jgi:hypothetical protein